MANIIDEYREEIQNNFTKNIIPLLEKYKPNTIDEINEVDTIIRESYKKFDWMLRKYENTYRVSAHSSSVGYTFFMVWTPEELDEYNFGVDYYGSRKVKQ